MRFSTVSVYAAWTCRSTAPISTSRSSHSVTPSGHDRHEQLAQVLAVDVEVVVADAVVLDDPEVHLEVADHVRDDEPDPDDPGDRHHVLLADGGGVEVEEERLALAPGLFTAVPETGPRRSVCAMWNGTPA